MKENGFEYVDLGLPSGTMWATCNVGADKPEDSGLLFQFGLVDGYKYGDANHKFRTNKQDTDKTYYKGETLDLKYDAAHVNMGGKWQMPTNDKFEELLDNTIHEFKTLNEVEGMIFTSKINNNQLFIPFAGYWYDGNFMMTGYCADMWTSWVHDSNVDIGCSIGFSSSGFVAVDYDIISYAFSVRGVFKKITCFV